eukprot:1159090-Pelagomonas_calceolata.AAC.2
METSGHGALKENYFLDDGAYLAVKVRNCGENCRALWSAWAWTAFWSDAGHQMMVVMFLAVRPPNDWGHDPNG